MYTSPAMRDPSIHTSLLKLVSIISYQEYRGIVNVRNFSRSSLVLKC